MDGVRALPTQRGARTGPTPRGQDKVWKRTAGKLEQCRLLNLPFKLQSLHSCQPFYQISPQIHPSSPKPALFFVYATGVMPRPLELCNQVSPCGPQDVRKHTAPEKKQQWISKSHVFRSNAHSPSAWRFFKAVRNPTKYLLHLSPACLQTFFFSLLALIQQIMEHR